MFCKSPSQLIVLSENICTKVTTTKRRIFFFFWWFSFWEYVLVTNAYMKDKWAENGTASDTIKTMKYDADRFIHESEGLLNKHFMVIYNTTEL